MRVFRKLYNKLTGRRPERAMKTKHEIPPIEGAIYNICLTTLLTPKSAPAWTQGTLKSAPWTTVLALPAFDLVREAADRYYKSCDTAGALVPTVTRYQGAIRIEFAIDEFLAVGLFEPGETRLATGKRGEPLDFRVANAGMVSA